MTAKESYDNLVSILKEMADSFSRFAKDNNIDFEPESLVSSLDVILQHSLLQVSVSDYAVSANEILFLRDIAHHADWVDFFNAQNYIPNKLNWTSVYKSNLDDLKEYLRLADADVHKMADNIICIFAAYDLATPVDYAEQFKDAWINIATTLGKKDNEFSSVEKEATVKSIMSYVYGGIIHQMEKIKNKCVEKKAKEVRANCPHLKVAKKLMNSDKALLYSADNFNDTIVYIETDSGSGTGFVVSEWGHVITCAHVVNKSKKYLIKVCHEDQFKIVKADLINMDEEKDYALLKMQSGTYDYVKLANEEFKAKMGEEIAILGFPFGGLVADKIEDLSLSLTKGYVSSVQTKNGIKNVYLDCSARRGNSGSPVIDTKTGEVIGLLCGSITSGSDNLVEEINYMRPITYFWQLFILQ